MAKTTELCRCQTRGPVQARSLKRVEAACAAAEKLLVDLGPDRTSIPEIALLARIPRATIYQYFPDKYTLFAHLAAAQSQRIGEHMAKVLAKAGNVRWQVLVELAVNAAVEFYNGHKVAAILLLLGPFGHADRMAHVEKDRVLAERFRVCLGVEKKPSPDWIELAIKIAFACLSYGYVREGTLSPAIREEAVRAVTAYIAPFLSPKPA